MRVWELWFADFPFEEDATQSKKRPVIILNVEPLEVLSVKVTSKKARDNDKYDTPIVHWKEAGLKSESIARISKTIFLTQDKFEHKIGTLHDDDKVTILTKYTEFLKTNT